MIDLPKFIIQHITHRETSLFADDIQLNEHTLSESIKAKSVLVIGGAGSIGSSFIRAILPFKPKRLYVIDVSENNLTELTRDLRSSSDLKLPEEYCTYPINYGSTIFKKIWQSKGPFEIVANFAAHKHVRSERDAYSIEAMLQNNVLQAKSLLDALLDDPPEHFFCVSTDKAANPVNVMGASKKLMEDLILAYADRLPITTARFANVAFSNGSLLAGFVARLMKKQPIAAPNDVRRYFVSPQESGEICMLACLLGNSGEILFPKLEASSMKYFHHIAEKFLETCGFIPLQYKSEMAAKVACEKIEKHYPVFFFESETSGEKLFEEFYTPNERVNFNRFKQLGVIEDAPRKTIGELTAICSDLSIFLQKPKKKSDIVMKLQEYVEGFHHKETGKSLDQKM